MINGGPRPCTFAIQVIYVHYRPSQASPPHSREIASWDNHIQIDAQQRKDWYIGIL